MEIVNELSKFNKASTTTIQIWSQLASEEGKEHKAVFLLDTSRLPYFLSRDSFTQKPIDSPLNINSRVLKLEIENVGRKWKAPRVDHAGVMETVGKLGDNHFVRSLFLNDWDVSSQLVDVGFVHWSRNLQVSRVEAALGVFWLVVIVLVAAQVSVSQVYWLICSCFYLNFEITSLQAKSSRKQLLLF